MRIFAVLALFLAGMGFAHAQEMPAPHKSPRVPVSREPIGNNQAPAIKSREVEGPATVFDGDHLRVDNVDLRLFGIVPPQLSASFGPQARTALDQITRGQNVRCHVRDRDHDGRFLATCTTANNNADLAIELLRRGLAVTARGSLEPTDLATPYAAAEDAARNQKIGLWSVTVPPPATVTAAPPAPAAASPPTPAEIEIAKAPPLPSELKRDEKPADKNLPITVITGAAEKSADQIADKTADKTIASSLAESAPQANLFAPGMVAEGEVPGAPGFFARYQLLFTGLVMLMTAFGIMAVLAVQRRRDQRDEMRAIAAALRGELLAARAVCQARLKLWDDADEKNSAWPRIRATLYQAYVGRLGWLGAVLARQVASIYGQAGDYAAYFNPSAHSSSDPSAQATKHQALTKLVQHIEQVLPKLAAIEHTGMRPKGEPFARPKDFIVAQAMLPESHAAPAPQPAAPSPPAPSSPPPSAHAHQQPAALSLAPLWDAIRRFTVARKTADIKQPPVSDEPLVDYTSLIEEEMARMSYGDDPTPPPANVTKIRTRT